MTGRDGALSAREREIAERYAGGATYSRIAGDLHIAPSTVRNHLAAIYRKLGVRNKPALIEALRDAPDAAPGVEAAPAPGLDDQGPIRYCTAADGVSIAHAQIGSGPPLFLGGSWMTHLEMDWDNPGYGHYLRHLGEDHTIVRYDQRGNGLSDHDGVEISFEKMVGDLETVVEAYPFERFSLFGASQAAAVSIAYAVRHPRRVARLVLFGGYPRGRRRRNDPEAAAESAALATLIRQGWGRENPAYRQTMTTMFMPGASPPEVEWFNAFQKACGPAENIARFREIFDEIDIVHLLDEVRVPTLVVHCTGDSVAPLSEGRLLATRIRDARFVTLDSGSHMVLERDPEFPRFLRAVREFLSAG